ncbi:HAMP domain-containing protein [Microvirga aerophila]|uniref:HAMP domain-containing protein n=1 Tax=Microvirga aerophila TaxID=670291 RepID=A0A512BXU1_9HYPH|nr:HAMP domain-containing protein [Microvirga aerophila]GEO16776.1 hypothetical protein MAE02_44720 [Microvirga aerophila]
MSFFARLRWPSVRVRVAALSGVMVLGFAVIGGVFHAGRGDVERALDTQQIYNALAEKAYQFRVQADALKVTAREWTASRLAHHGQAFMDQHRALAAQLDQMNAAPGADLIAADIKALGLRSTALSEQAAALDKLYKQVGYQAEDGARGALLSTAASLEKLVRPLASGGEPDPLRLWAATLGMFNQEARARILIEDTILGAFEVEQGRFTRAVGRLGGDTAEAKPAILAAGEAYQAAFNTWAEVEKKVSGEGERLTGQFDLLVPALEQLLAKVRAEAQATNTHLIASQQHTFTLILWAMGGALALGLALTLLVGRSIALPLTRLQRAMQRLADGDASTEIPSTKESDEIGAMARTVLVFRDNARERERLTGSGREWPPWRRSAPARSAAPSAPSERPSTRFCPRSGRPRATSRRRQASSRARPIT